jgi:hypothetical protein
MLAWCPVATTDVDSKRLTAAGPDARDISGLRTPKVFVFTAARVAAD